MDMYERVFQCLQVFHCVHFECPSFNEKDSFNWLSETSSKQQAQTNTEPVSDVNVDQAQPTETATEAEEMLNPAGAEN